MSKKKRASIDNFMTIPQLVAFLKQPKPTVYYWLKINKIKWEWFGEVKVVLKKDAEKAKNFLL